jgi:hypothetical protein
MAIAPTVKNRGAGRGARCESVRGPVKCGLFCFVARSLSVLYWFMGKSSATVAPEPSAANSNVSITQETCRTFRQH